jgi:AraC-like DNA-binding protein
VKRRASTARRDAREKFIASELLSGAAGAARELGVDLAPALAAAGIDPALLAPPSRPLEIRKLLAFLDDAAVRFNYPYFGLLAGAHTPPLSLGLVGHLVRYAANLGEALADSLRFGRTVNETEPWHLRREAGLVSLVRHNWGSSLGSSVQLQMLAVTQVHHALRALCDGKFVALEISFSHSPPGPTKQLQKFFSAPVCFNRDFNGIVFAEALLETPLPAANAELHGILAKHLESTLGLDDSGDDVARTVGRCIRHRLPGSSCNLENVATVLGKNTRTLQRELRQHGVTFRQLVTEIRRGLAEDYLRHSTISLTELSDMLGYGNVSALSRAFKQCTGLSPDQWRRVHGRSWPTSAAAPNDCMN